MKSLSTRLQRLERHFVQPDYLRNPRRVMRIVVSGLGKEQGIGPAASCNRTLCPDGTLMECVDLDGYGGLLNKDQIDQFVNSFPITILDARRANE